MVEGSLLGKKNCVSWHHQLQVALDLQRVFDEQSALWQLWDGCSMACEALLRIIKCHHTPLAVMCISGAWQLACFYDQLQHPIVMWPWFTTFFLPLSSKNTHSEKCICFMSIKKYWGKKQVQSHGERLVMTAMIYYWISGFRKSRITYTVLPIPVTWGCAKAFSKKK